MDLSAQAEEAEEQHWSVAHPPNVQIVDRASVDELNDWLETHASEPTPVWEKHLLDGEYEEVDEDDDAELDDEGMEMVGAAQADRSKVPF